MTEPSFNDPSTLRFGIFITVLLLCAVWEHYRPRKALSAPKTVRWFNNLTLVALNGLLIALLLPLTAFEAAKMTQDQQMGIFHQLSLPIWANVLLSVIALDLIIYLQHLLFHRLPWLWRLHRMHHADLDIDVTTGTRFHPIEILLSMLIKIGSVFALGVSPLAIVAFEIILNASAMFNHSNAKLPLRLDAVMRKVIVTPDMHRVHHSVIARETHSNFGFFLSLWDRVFRTYVAQPKLGHQRVQIGVPEIRKAREQWLDKMLTQPFRYQTKRQ
ncbi:sterol desaturase family protein [Vibrio navarrensis]|uniref:Sterol desaturase family protein n=1 Tax=Vibrio navarrensis TaxID=29495 RepID=A0AAI9CWN6_9VIBR|nr:sterol desaturase family protein [Vibrio navarrensis]EGR2797563.1 sterol desaturase family protein [Vibrio navarrensis]EJL6395730.1 sterol desaturase family protein [Vibrio navarrensis]EKA5636968.1 sterol desaturase family protein [Vibrio navarrensis]ELN6933761.1 sterol desaturase family protein [Vibrio navarrensis]KGK16855.1 sterol desaturase [Vibrio navarrensis]